MITQFGYFLIITLLIASLMGYKYVVCALIIFCPFMYTSVAYIGEKYIQPYIICELFIVVKVFFLEMFKRGKRISNKRLTIACFALMFYGLFVTLVCPFLFEGTYVVGKDLDDSYYNGFERLKFGMNNIAQMGYLILNLITLLCLYSNKWRIRAEEIRTYLVISITISIFIGYWEFINKVSGAIPFPIDFLLNGNPYEGVAYERFRMASLCGEASLFGPFVSASFWALLYIEKSVFKYLLLPFVLIAVVLNFSGTAIMSFIFGFFLYFFREKVSLKVLLCFFVIGLCVIFLLHIVGLYADTISMVLEKSESSSGNVRLGTTIRSMELFIESMGIGIGMGSTRSSSFLIDLLACTGVVGFICVFMIYKLLILNKWNYKNYSIICIFSLVILFGQAIAVPDFSYSFFWMALFMAASYSIDSSKHLYK